MVGKNILTVLIFVSVLFAAFFGYQHFKKKKDLEVHHQDTYSRMTEAAKKSPRAGLTQMGGVLKKYYAENKSYPPSLDALYPKYMPSKSFVSDVNWNYQSKGSNFLLSKSATIKGRTILASIDKSLKIRQGTRTTIAMVDKQPLTVPSATTSVPTPASKAGTSPKVATEDIPATVHPPVGLPPTIETPVEKNQKTKISEDIAPLKTETKTVSVDTTETPSGYVSELSNTYLVWKDEEDNLGFGNVQYPRIDPLSIATPHNWFNVKRHPEKEAYHQQEILTSKDETDIELLASNLSEQFLVWKNRDGTVGFGNNQYPAAGDIEYINVNGVWYKFTR